MSRIPQPSSSRSTTKPSATPVKSRISAISTPSRARTQSSTGKSTTLKPITAAARPVTPARAKPAEIKHVESPSAAGSLSIKEAIALKRAEAKKAHSIKSSGLLDDTASLEDTSPLKPAKQEEEDLLGRLSVRDTIEKARSSGSLNLATRSLPCLPSALFEIHLGVKPDPLKLVPEEPPYPPASSAQSTGRGGGRRDAPAWFEAQDLQIIKAWNNEIVEIQHEISLFGSLKTIDLHSNKLTSLPDSFADLTALNVLDLSHNSLTSLPTNLFALPELTILNVSHNELTSLPFSSPFSSNKIYGQSRVSGFFAPAIVRATSPLPRLITLNASHNKINAHAIDLSLPVSLAKIDMCANPLGSCQAFLKALASLRNLKEARFEKADLDNQSFFPETLSSSPFPSLLMLDLSETSITLEIVKHALKGMRQELNFDFTTEDPPAGVTRVLVGKKVVKEAWELELERRGKSRAATTAEDTFILPSQTGSKTSTKATANPPKETWEIEAEQGLLTEGGRRRARAAAANDNNTKSVIGLGSPSSPKNEPSRPSSSSSGIALTSPKYYSSTTNTLTLPPSAPPSKKPTHGRAFSLAVPSTSIISSSISTKDLTVPAPSLPLDAILSQPFADTLTTLKLVNRRMDRSFSLPRLPESLEGFLPKLEELDLEGCNFLDEISVTISDVNTTALRSSHSILPLIAKLFPSLRTLNMSYNTLTSQSLTTEALSEIILSSEHRKGLRHLRLRGNKLSELDGFKDLAQMFKGNREVLAWKLEELDLRDNEIGKIPPEMGLLPMDVFLVDGNIFRVPQRRVWEREGTKGLLSWLRGRIE